MSHHLLTINFTLALISCLVFFFVVPVILIIKNKKTYTFTYLFLYILLLIIGVFFDITITYKSVTIDLQITDNWFAGKPIIANFARLGILINIALLFPLGFIFPLLKKNIEFHKTILYISLISLLIEFLQFSLPIKRYPELLDILNNTISAILGYSYYYILNKMIGGNKHDRLSQ